MKFLVVMAASLAVSNAIVCFKGICDHLPKQEDLKCRGSVIKNGGFCGCQDVCAKVEGESCQERVIRGRMSLGECDTGLTCEHEKDMMIGAGTCVNDGSQKQERSTARTVCQHRRIASMISMVVYRGQWFPKCDQNGKFEPMQCDNTKMCFCVDTETGLVDESTKMLGAANCEPGYRVTTVSPGLLDP